MSRKATFRDVSKFAVSDDYLVYICINLKVKSKQHKTIRNRDFKYFNVDNFIADLDMSNIICRAIFDDKNTIDIWNKWKGEYLNTSSIHTPFKEKRGKERYNHWITSYIIK